MIRERLVVMAKHVMDSDFKDLVVMMVMFVW